jgi:hypothetical protein
MMGNFVPISAGLFCLAYATTQAWLCQRRLDRVSYRWIGLSLVGLIVAILTMIAAWFLAIWLWRLDVLQNSQHGAIGSRVMLIVFSVMMIWSQWLVLRGRVRYPISQAVLNVISGTATWSFLVAGSFANADRELGLPLLLGGSVGLGAGLGGFVHKILHG